jgi:hypothetical protein
LTDAPVEKMADDQVKAFHQGNPSVRLAYMPLLMSQGSPLTLHLLRDIIVRLQQFFPEQSASLTVLQRELIWQSQVAPFGGRS